MCQRILGGDSRSRLAFVSGVVLAALVVAPAFPYQCWNSIATVGAVDESGTAIYSFSGANASLRASASLPANLVLRYPVESMPDLNLGDGVSLKVLYRDNGEGARIYATLQELNLSSGAIKTIVTFDSNLFPQSSSTQRQAVVSACQDSDIIQMVRAYWVEVHIVKSNSSGTPLLQGLQICYSFC